MTDTVTPTTTTQTSATDQAAADALAASAAKVSGDSAVKTAEQIATEAASTTPVPVNEIVYALTLPKDAVIEAQATERLAAFAKAHGLSNDVAQHALDLANAEVVADRARQIEATAETFKTLAFETWLNEIKADKEFGGDKFDGTVEASKRAAEAAWTPEERKILNETGWGNHPLLVRGMARLGRRMGNDTLVMGNAGGAAQTKTVAQTMYPTMNP